MQCNKACQRQEELRALWISSASNILADAFGAVQSGDLQPTGISGMPLSPCCMLLDSFFEQLLRKYSSNSIKSIYTTPKLVADVVPPNLNGLKRTGGQNLFDLDKARKEGRSWLERSEEAPHVISREEVVKPLISGNSNLYVIGETNKKADYTLDDVTGAGQKAFRDKPSQHDQEQQGPRKAYRVRFKGRS